MSLSIVWVIINDLNYDKSNKTYRNFKIRLIWNGFETQFGEWSYDPSRQLDTYIVKTLFTNLIDKYPITTKMWSNIDLDDSIESDKIRTEFKNNLTQLLNKILSDINMEYSELSPAPINNDIHIALKELENNK